MRVCVCVSIKSVISIGHIFNCHIIHIFNFLRCVVLKNLFEHVIYHHHHHLSLVTLGLAELASRKYKPAAKCFLQASFDHCDFPEVGVILSPVLMLQEIFLVILPIEVKMNENQFLPTISNEMLYLLFSCFPPVM